MKAMILAAGRGKRMAHLTEDRPKPLLPVGDKSLIEWQLSRLAEAGFVDVVINLGYKGHLIEQTLGNGRRYGIRIHYSREPETGLETAGGIIQALPYLSDGRFLLLNADVWCDVDLLDFIGRVDKDCLAHLLLVPVPSWRKKGDFGLSGQRVIAGETWVFSGISVISPRLLINEPLGYKALAPFLHQAVAQGKVSGVTHRGEWRDIGTPERLALLQESYKL